MTNVQFHVLTWIVVGSDPNNASCFVKTDAPPCSSVNSQSLSAREGGASRPPAARDVSVGRMRRAAIEERSRARERAGEALDDRPPILLGRVFVELFEDRVQLASELVRRRFDPVTASAHGARHTRRARRYT
jgi:hypothetical protein